MTSAVVIVVAGLAVLVLRRVLGARTLDATWLAFGRVPFNALAFRLRRAVGWRRGRPDHSNEPKGDLFDYVEEPRARAALESRERTLRDAYALAPLAARSTREVYRDNLYVLDLLDRCVAPALRGELALRSEGARAEGALAEGALRDGSSPGQAVATAPSTVRVVDVGSKDFRYAFALERFVTAFAPPAAETSLLGVELDGHPIYPDLHSRADHAEAFAAEVEAAPRPGRTASRVRYRVADYLTVDERDLDVVFFFFPFVLRYTLVRWGLPLGQFVPDRLFEHAERALRPGGLLVVVNHTQEELVAQRAILARIPSLAVDASADARSELVAYYEQLDGRAITVARKRAEPAYV